MGYEEFECLRVRVDGGVAFVVIDHPPINLFDLPLMLEIDRLGRLLETDEAVRVVVFESANPDFFIAHADVEMIEKLPTQVEERPTELNFFHQAVDRFRSMPRATIAKIEGRARGGGSEFLLSLDMRFGAIGRCRLGQPEVALGILPGGSATQRLPRLMGRSRAMEVVLGCEDFDAELAERYGWINRALPADEIGPFVERLARRIARFPAHAIALAKQCVNATDLGLREGLLAEGTAFTRTLSDPETRRLLARFLEIGGQTRDVELELDILEEL